MKVATIKRDRYLSYIFVVACYFALSFTWGDSLRAAEIERWADGACWLSKSIPLNEDEPEPLYSLASFNDQVAVQFSSFQLVNLLSEKYKAKFSHNKFRSSNPTLNFHCGAYGHSVLVKFRPNDSEGAGYCAWMYFKDGEWQVRSFGGLGPHEESGSRCHGLKRGNLLLYVKTSRDHQMITDQLNKDFEREISSIQKVSQNIYRIELKEEYLDLEKSVREKMIKHALIGPFVDVEFNWFSHSVGEFKE